MVAGLLADLVFLVHLGFIAWVMVGGLAVLFRGWLAWLHLPAVTWAAAVELLGLWCPLTPVEQKLLSAAGEAGYEGGFIAHYLLPLIYPAGLTREVQLVLGAIVVVVNLAVYAAILRRGRRGARRRSTVG